MHGKCPGSSALRKSRVKCRTRSVPPLFKKIDYSGVRGERGRGGILQEYITDS